MILASEIGVAGEILKLYYDIADCNGTGKFFDFEMKMCHTGLTELTDNFEDNYDGNTPVVVVPTGTLNFPNRNDYWFDMPGFTSFEYNGTDNLIIELRFSGSNNRKYYTWYDDITGRNLLGRSYDATAGSVSDMLLRVKIWITYGAIESSSLGNIKAVFK
ncbi:MAG: hypothetical protein GY771_17005 [bacterium]|nr:hypothetical protein [bacterium]